MLSFNCTVSYIVWVSILKLPLGKLLNTGAEWEGHRLSHTAAMKSILSIFKRP